MIVLPHQECTNLIDQILRNTYLKKQVFSLKKF